MKKKVILLVSHFPGEKIIEFFSKKNTDEILAIYFEYRNNYSRQLIKKFKLNRIKIFYGKKIFLNVSHLNWIKKQKIDFLISVYWPWLIPKDFYTRINDSINFHPSYLPINRGWYPHVHSILDGSIAGVTLHRINEFADKGNIWVQKRISIKINETSDKVYYRLQEEIIKLFNDNWSKIKNKRIKPIKQIENKANFHSKKEMQKIDKIDLKNISADKFFNILKARSFGNKAYGYIILKKKKFYLNLRISNKSDFNS